jgi:hypothetical protein
VIIYVSAPYSLGNVTDNVRRACNAGDVILAKGHIPFIPHLSHLWHLISPKSYEEWLRIDMALLDMCDALVRLPGESPGADREVKEAEKLCIPVYYGLEEVPNGEINGVTL